MILFVALGARLPLGGVFPPTSEPSSAILLTRFRPLTWNETVVVATPNVPRADGCAAR